MCINLGFLAVEGTIGTPMVSPFDLTQNVTSVTPPAFFNSTDPTGTFIGNLSSQAFNSSGNWWDETNEAIANYFNFGLGVLSFVISIATGAFIWNLLGVLGLPDVFVYGLQGVIGFLLFYWIVYLITGKG